MVIDLKFVLSLSGSSSSQPKPASLAAGLDRVFALPFFSPFVAVAIFLVQSYYAGFGSMDYTMERHLKVRDSIRFVRSNRGLALGNGAVFILLLMTGIGFLFALPLSTAASTPEVVKRL